MGKGMISQEAITYIRQFIEAHDPIATKLTTRFPFRRLADHCYRTYRWAQRIQEYEGGDREIAEIAALFHDVGKCVDNTSDGHARAGAEICEQYLVAQGYNGDRTARIVYIVRNHVHAIRDVSLSLEAQIVRDADLLDEVGALTVLWDAMAAGAEEQQSYMIAYQRIRAAYVRLKGRDLSFLETATGKRFYEERAGLLGHFVSELAYELGTMEASL
jgi:uncharacterized protein